MSGYLDHLVDRTLGVMATLQPRPRSRFEPGPVGEPGVESTSGWTEPSTADRMELAPARGTVPERTVSPRLATPRVPPRRPGAAPASRDTPRRDDPHPPDPGPAGQHPPDHDHDTAGQPHGDEQDRSVGRHTRSRATAPAEVASEAPQEDHSGPRRPEEPSPTAAAPHPIPEGQAGVEPPVPIGAVTGLPSRITVGQRPAAEAEIPIAASPTPIVPPPGPSGHTTDVDERRADAPEGANAVAVPLHQPAGRPEEAPAARGTTDVGRQERPDRLTGPPVARASPAPEPLEEGTARAGPAAARARPPAVAGRTTRGTPAQPAVPPKVTVTIGRVEIRQPPVPPPVPEPPAGPQPLSLDEYLDRRGGPP